MLSTYIVEIGEPLATFVDAPPGPTCVTQRLGQDGCSRDSVTSSAADAP